MTKTAENLPKEGKKQAGNGKPGEGENFPTAAIFARWLGALAGRRVDFKKGGI